MPKTQPLADRMRPISLDDVVGQQHLIGSGQLLRRMIETDSLRSVILYGPPGTGKTSLAQVIANTTAAEFRQINATTAGKADMKAAVDAAQALQDAENRGTILFIDEIHRFNKAQQDYLLPYVENGTVTLIGATTENPYFEVNPALVSRSVIFQLKPIQATDIEAVVDKALTGKERGLGEQSLSITREATLMLTEQANGDIRLALSTLELASLIAQNGEITEDDVKAVIQKPHLRYDKDGDMHYDTISAFIKSMRGSDPDAVLYYLARMIHAGEDPKFIARRIMIHAAEDVGNADPMALVLATSASLAAERIGWPEAQIILAQAAIYVAMAPKCNTAAASIGKAMDYVAKHPSNDVPNHLRDSHYKGAAKLGHGVDYRYPHDYPGHWIPQQYLPDGVDEHFYQNSHMGHEAAQAKYQNDLRSQLRPK